MERPPFVLDKPRCPPLALAYLLALLRVLDDRREKEPEWPTGRHSHPQICYLQRALGLLGDSRERDPRNPATGEKKAGADHGGWLGALGYMALLDQIGTCLKPRAVVKPGNGIERALAYFTSLQYAEIQALYALRCAFAHNYSLANVGRQGRQHLFKVVAGDATPLVTLPTIPWKGWDRARARPRATVPGPGAHRRPLGHWT